MPAPLIPRVWRVRLCSLAILGSLFAACSPDSAPPGALPPSAAAAAGSGAPVCSGAVCTCHTSQTRCGGLCANLSNDPSNCGACGVSCNGGVCEAGRCACPSTLTSCGLGCADTTTDVANCGACGVACAPGDLCQAGVCMKQCIPPCIGGQLCAAGVCQCPPGTDFCGTMCVDLKSTPQHCSACGKMCMPGEVCQAGQCACPLGQIKCDNQCADLQLSPQHCGACGQACDESETCMAGTCRAPIGADGCTGEPRDLTLAEVAAYQTIKVTLVKNGAAVPDAMRESRLARARLTLFRVGVTTGAGFAPREFSARVTVTNGAEVDQYYAKQMVSKSSTDEDSASTFQVYVPADRVGADTKYRIEVVECGATVPGAGAPPPGTAAPATPPGGAAPPAAGAGAPQAGGAAAPTGSAATHFPATGDAELQAIDTGTLRIKLIPIRANNMIADTDEKSLDVYRQYILAMYPLSKIEFTVGEEIASSGGTQINWNNLIEQIRAKRQRDMPESDIYYYGMLRPTATFRDFCRRGCTAGVGFVGSTTQPNTRVALGVAFADGFSSITMAHEVGHNHGRNHAPCPENGGISGVDRSYPYDGAKTGIWGFDPRMKKLMNPTEHTDIMGYCDPKWISDYTYNGLFDRLVALNGMGGAMPFEIADPAVIQKYSVLLNDEEGPRWSIPFERAEAPYGVPESADVLDLDGNMLDQVTVYRTQIGDSDASTVLIPEAEPGWHAIKIADALPLPFTAPITVPMY